MDQVAAHRLKRVAVAAESIHHRHNISAVLRSCDAFGIHEVHLVERTFVPGKGAARGAERWLDLHLHPDPVSAVRHLKAQGWQLWVADVHGEAVPPEDVPLDKPVCLWLGNELLGVGEHIRAEADGVVQIPMVGFTRSLNVSVAAGLLLYEITRRAHQAPDAHLTEAEQAELVARWKAQDEPYLEALEARYSSSK